MPMRVVVTGAAGFIGSTLVDRLLGEGNVVFDFLKGEHRYKDQLATAYRNTLGVRVFRNSPGALAYRLRRIWLLPISDR